MAQKEACNDLRYLGSAAGRQDGSEQLAPNNTNQQGRYSPVPTQQNQPPGQQFSSYLPYGQQSLAGPPVGQQYPAAQPPGQGYPMSGQPAPSAPPLEQQYQPYGQYPVGQQLSGTCSNFILYPNLLSHYPVDLWSLCQPTCHASGKVYFD